MNNNFLAALRAKSARVTQKLTAPEASNGLADYYAKSVSQSVVNDFTSGNVVDLPAPAPELPPIEVSIQANRTRNRLDVAFSRKPSDETRGKLKARGFQFCSDSGGYWYHRDTPLNRAFLVQEFSADFGEELEIPAPVPVPAGVPDGYTVRPIVPGITAIQEIVPVSDNVLPDKTETEPSVMDYEEAPEWTCFKSRVNALCAHLSCAPSDLMLPAINALYKQTFPH